MVSGPITSWEIDGETVETVSDFVFLGSKITGEGKGYPFQYSCPENSMGSQRVGHDLAAFASLSVPYTACLC